MGFIEWIVENKVVAKKGNIYFYVCTQEKHTQYLEQKEGRRNKMLVLHFFSYSFALLVCAFFLFLCVEKREGKTGEKKNGNGNGECECIIIIIVIIIIVNNNIMEKKKKQAHSSSFFTLFFFSTTLGTCNPAQSTNASWWWARRDRKEWSWVTLLQ